MMATVYQVASESAHGKETSPSVGGVLEFENYLLAVTDLCLNLCLLFSDGWLSQQLQNSVTQLFCN